VIKYSSWASFTRSAERFMVNINCTTIWSTT
jgi:hypothetical protein